MNNHVMSTTIMSVGVVSFIMGIFGYTDVVGGCGKYP